MFLCRIFVVGKAGGDLRACLPEFMLGREHASPMCHLATVVRVFLSIGLGGWEGGERVVVIRSGSNILDWMAHCAHIYLLLLSFCYYSSSFCAQRWRARQPTTACAIGGSVFLFFVFRRLLHGLQRGGWVVEATPRYGGAKQE